MVDEVMFYKEMTHLIWYPPEKSGSYEIPSIFKTFGTRAFIGQKKLSSLVFHGFITKIADYVFRSCYRLVFIANPISINFIGSTAFSSCRAFASITIPNSVVYIGYSSFEGCSVLKSISIPQYVTSI